MAKQVQFKVTLPDQLRAALDEAAARSGRALAEEMRVRIAHSISEDAVDPEIRAFGEDMIGVAWALMKSFWWTAPFSSWRDDPLVHEAMKVAINRWLEINKPHADRPEGAARDLFDPKTLGMAAASAYERKKKEIAAARRSAAAANLKLREAMAAAEKSIEKARKSAETAGRKDAMKLPSKIKGKKP